MTENWKKALKCAKGKYQLALLYGEPISANLRGKAKQYSGRYEKSAMNLISRLRTNKIKFKIEYGPRGGWFSARILIEGKENA